MKFLNLPQNESEWHRWRRQGIGASEAPVIMGVSPWTDPVTLWKRKLGKEPEQEQTYVMRRGLRLEPVARQLFTEQTGIEVFPECVASDQHPWQRSSLDGLSPFGDTFIEIKCPNIKDHRLALDGGIPEHYWPQVQHSYCVTECKRAFYVSYSEKKELSEEEQLAIVPIEPDLDYHCRLLEREVLFWGCVVEQRDPGFLYVGKGDLTSPETTVKPSQEAILARASFFYYRLLPD